MKQATTKIMIMGLNLLCLLVLASHAGEGKQTLKIAVLPCTNIVMTFKKFHPLISYLTQETEFEIKLMVPQDLAEFASSIKSQDIDFALQDPHTFVKLASLLDGTSLIQTLTMEGGNNQAGVVVVRKDSHLSQIKELKEKKVMFGPKFSSAKWLAAKVLFQDSGISLQKDLKSYVHGGCCEDIAFSVALKSVDAGVVCDHFLTEHEEKQKELGVRGERLKVIGRTIAVPTRVFGPRKDLSTDIVNAINRALLRLDKKNPEHAKILARAEIGGFRVSRDENLQPIRVLMDLAKED